MNDQAKIIEYDRVAEAIVKKAEQRISINRATAKLVVDIADLRGKAELTAVAGMIIADVREIFKEVDHKYNQLLKIKERLEELE